MVAQLVKNLPSMRETWIRFLGWEDPLEKGIATHSSILAWIKPLFLLHNSGSIFCLVLVRREPRFWQQVWGVVWDLIVGS